MAGCLFRGLARCGVYSTADDVTVDTNEFVNCGTGGDTTGNFVATVWGNGNRFRVINNKISNCNWGVISRGADASTRRFDCHVINNEIICKSASEFPQAQGISASYNRGMHVTGNTVIGFMFNAIDQQACEFSVITENTCRSSSDGVFVGDRSFTGHTISQNIFENCVRGVRYYNTNSEPDYQNQLMQATNITGNIIIAATDAGISVDVTGDGTTARTAVVSDNNIFCNSVSTRGILAKGLSNSRVSGNTIYRPKQEGILLQECDGIAVMENHIQDASMASAGTSDAISVASTCDRVFVRNSYVVGGARNAVIISGGANHTVAGTRARSISGSVVVDNGLTTILADNLTV